MVTNNAAWEQPGFSLGQFESNVDLSAESPAGSPTAQFCGVVLVAATGAGCVGPYAIALPASSGVPILGLLQNNPQVAEAAELVTFGVSKAQAGAAVSAAGVLLAVNTTTGQLRAATAGDYIVAQSLQAAAGAGTIFSVYVDNYGVHP